MRFFLKVIGRGEARPLYIRRAQQFLDRWVARIHRPQENENPLPRRRASCIRARQLVSGARPRSALPELPFGVALNKMLRDRQRKRLAADSNFKRSGPPVMTQFELSHYRAAYPVSHKCVLCHPAANPPG